MRFSSDGELWCRINGFRFGRKYQGERKVQYLIGPNESNKKNINSYNANLPIFCKNLNSEPVISTSINHYPAFLRR